MQTHTLSPEEVDLITSILDAEERNLDNMYANGSSLTMLEAQCRDIWPNWETSQRISPTRYESQFYSRQRSQHLYDDESDTPTKTTVFNNANNTRNTSSNRGSPISNTSPINSNYSPRQSSPIHNQDLVNYDFQNMKTDIDDLYNRIQLMSSGSGSSSPTAQQFKASQQRTPANKQQSFPSQTLSTPSSSFKSSRHSTPRTIASPISRAESDSDDIQKIKAENYMLKAQLEKVQKLLEIEQAQNKKLEAALKKNSRISGSQ